MDGGAAGAAKQAVTDLVRKQAVALGRCTMLPGSWDKRFARDAAAIAERGGTLTDSQARNVERLAWKYRRQMPANIAPVLKP